MSIRPQTYKCHDCNRWVENCTCYEASRQSILKGVAAVSDSRPSTGSARMPTKLEMKAFDEGNAAYGRGATLDDNPYPKFDAHHLPHELHCMWICGWTNGECDSPNNQAQARGE